MVSWISLTYANYDHLKAAMIQYGWRDSFRRED